MTKTGRQLLRSFELLFAACLSLTPSFADTTIDENLSNEAIASPVKIAASEKSNAMSRELMIHRR